MAGDLQDELFEDFLLETSERLERLEEGLLDLEQTTARPDPDDERLAGIRRDLHTLKGNAGLMGLADLQGLAHELEERIDALPEGTGAPRELLEGLDRFREILAALASGKAGGEGEEGDGGPEGLRVPFESLDLLVEQLAQTVILRNRLEDALARRGAAREGKGGPSDRTDAIEAAYEPLARHLDRLQDGVLALRMVPLARLFRGLRRLVHDEAAREGKDVRFEARGGETPLDKALLEVASDTLGHLVRNAVAHGIETSAARRAAGKAEAGVVRVRARSASSEVHVEVSDDGAGIDREALLRRAGELGLDPGAEQTTDPDLHELLFRQGVSTRASVDLGAGRGVGLAAVRDAVVRFNGRIDVWSSPGEGTGFRLRLPLSVSIVRVLLVAVDDEEYALPLASVVESRNLAPGVAHRMSGALVLPWRDGLLPLVDLGVYYGTARTPRSAGAVAVVESDRERRGLLVDRFLGLRNVVVRGLEGVGRPPGLAGSTILGDGRVVLIADPADLAVTSPLQGAA
ncbi:MAG: chemotaxis protein CheA [Thermoanaerobaculia bacterium]